ncbi:DUF6236 family protein [Aromatoleum diolicum]|uniref:Uncharacterized protein n=1 Tax=Aromatoleum diolicum TaxID=75796 RepID=A0ABX1Q565_9RHOO|nr:DUF6236 family protein [Aromatoleum diolicum]NMG73428.1 hypothetical protein [Aromatoleum diolicum]
MQPIDSRFALPPGQRGLVISTPARQQENGSWRIGKYLDPQNLRCALLFWDRLAWPSPHVMTQMNEEESTTVDYLESSGVLVRPGYPGAVRVQPEPRPFSGPQGSGIYSDLATEGLRQRVNALGGRIPEKNGLPSPLLGIAIRHLLTYMEADAVEPGAWALANDVSSMLEGTAESDTTARGLLVSLFNCIPIPEVSVPLAEILKFKCRRYDELIALRTEIEQLYLRAQGDTDLALRSAKERIDRACADAIKVAREAHFPFRLSGIKAGFALPVGTIIGEALIGGWMDKPFAMPTTEALLVGAFSTLALAWDIVPRVVQPSNMPYRYITGLHSEML